MGKPIVTSAAGEEPLVEDRLLNYIWVYKDNKKKRERRLFSDFFNPALNRGCQSNRSICTNSDLPIKQKVRTKTEVWLKQEKRKLQHEIAKSVSAYKGKKPEIKSADVKKLHAKIKSEQKLQGIVKSGFFLLDL